MIRFECPKCGGDSVGYEATSDWNVVDQVWELGGSYHDGWCSDCGDVKPVAIPLTRAEIAEMRGARANAPRAQLLALVRSAEDALTLAIERLELNNCEGEERPYIRSLGRQRRELRAARRKVA